MGTIEHVGETDNTKRRWKQHVKDKPYEYSKNGKFYRRQDIVMNIVKEFDNKKDARRLETQLKLEYGLPTTERDRDRKNGLKNSEPVVVYKTDGTFVGEYYSAIECSRVLDLHQASVARVVLGKQKTAEGYVIKKK
jgi:hypothetical protein